MATRAQLPLCVYCGTERPADHSRCATCGRTWIDIRVGSSQRIPVAAAVGATVEAGHHGAVAVADHPGSEILADPDEFLADWDPWAVPPAKDKERMRWLIPSVLAGAVVVVYGLIFLGFLEGGQGQAPTTVAAPETTVVTPTTATPTTTVTPTTEGPVTTTSTTSVTETTTVDYTTLFPGSGDAVTLNNITLRSSSIGPIEFGTPASEAADRLVASLRTPEAGGAAGEEHGLCPGDTGFWLRWGELLTVFSGEPENGTFVGYRYEAPPGPATPHLAIGTLSGITLDDTIADLESTYAQFTIRYEDIAGRQHFSLLEGGELLLWGPITSSDQSGRIAGIYSPNACTG
jgi:hypothetical protein